MSEHSERLIDPILQRRSPRAFAEREPSGEQLRLLFEAARWAASSFNGQPWR
ncbi:MAG: nitroreductase family protein, partial [Myxococcales bacterium]|nr:nitroreductase family protein [Myxococcales bacterium]